jgi:hypothetical protein
MVKHYYKIKNGEELVGSMVAYQEANDRWFGDITLKGDPDDVKYGVYALASLEDLEDRVIKHYAEEGYTFHKQ